MTSTLKSRLAAVYAHLKDRAYQALAAEAPPTLAGLFDLAFYNAQAGTRFGTLESAALHYVTEGAARGFAPNPYFDAGWYAETYNVTGGPAAPLLDYAKRGFRLTRNPSRRFDTAWYIHAHPDLDPREVEPLTHFLCFGRAEGRAPTRAVSIVQNSGLLDLDHYNSQLDEALPDVRAAAEHYLTDGAARGLSPNPYFDAGWYAKTYSNDGGAETALLDYAENGAKLGRNPSTAFDALWYLARDPELKDHGSDPLIHYLHHGRAERHPRTKAIDLVQNSGLLDLDHYNRQLAKPVQDVLAAAEHYLAEGATAGISPNPYFDAGWYAKTYGNEGGAAAALIDFIENGVPLGRNPSAAFDAKWYLVGYPDLMEHGVEPLSHYLKHGRSERRARTNAAFLIQQLGLLDLEHYNSQLSEALPDVLAAVEHYLEVGGAQRLSPNPYFDAAWYAKTYRNKGGAAAALVDYAENGLRLGRSPSATFDAKWYLVGYPDLRDSGVEPLSHYLRYGRAEGRARTKAAYLIQHSGLLDLDYYNGQLADSLPDSLAGAEHYLATGAAQGIWPNLYFDPSWYAETYGIEGGAAAALLDFLENGISLGRNPSRIFDYRWYLDRYPELKDSGVEPLSHYLKHGRAEGRSPSPAIHIISSSGLLDVNFYSAQLIDPCKGAIAAAEHYLSRGADADLNPNAYFDTAWYRTSYPGVIKDGRNPLVDFIERAPRYDRNPSARFDCRWYLSRNADIAKAGVNPLFNFLSSGLREGRAPSPFVDEPTVPARFKNLLSELVPQDGNVEMLAMVAIDSVPEATKRFGSFKSAAADAWDRPRDDRSDIFPPRPYIATLQNVGIIGGSRLILTESNRMLSDEIATFSGSPDWCVRPRHLQIAATGKVQVDLVRRYPSAIARGAHLMHEYAANYFHMIVEVLPRLIAAEDIGLDPTLPLLVQDKLHPNLLKLIDIFNPLGRQLIALKSRQLYGIGELHYMSDVASIQDVQGRDRRREEVVLHRGLLRALAERVVGTLSPDSPKPSRRLYLRRASHGRIPVNETEVEEFLLTQGFETVLVDSLALAAQVRLFRQAAIVLAPNGAALTNMLWCQPGARICTLSSPQDAMPNAIWEQIADIAGCSLVSVLCEQPSGLDGDPSLRGEAIDLAALRQATDDLIERQAGV